MDSLITLFITLFGASIVFSGMPKKKTYREKDRYNREYYYREDNLSRRMMKLLVIVLFFYALGSVLTK